MRSELLPWAARLASAWRTSVDLPTPGSPPSTVTEPATSPPLRTLSSSPIPVATATAPSALIERRGKGVALGPEADENGESAARLGVSPEANDTSSSTRVFHSPQAEQRPDQRDEPCPQDRKSTRLNSSHLGIS